MLPSSGVFSGLYGLSSSQCYQFISSRYFYELFLGSAPQKAEVAPSQHSPAGGAEHAEPVLWVRTQRIDNVKEQNFKLQFLPLCFLCLEKYSLRSPTRGILRQEPSFVCASHRLEVTLAQGLT